MKLKDICKDKICKGIRIYTDKLEDVIDAYVIETKDVENCSLRYTKPDSIIMDPFMGSGTTGVVCKEMGRNFIGVELDKDLYEKAKDRINAVT